MVLLCHSEKLVRYLDPFIPNTVYSYSLKQKIDVDLDDEHCTLLFLLLKIAFHVLELEALPSLNLEYS